MKLPGLKIADRVKKLSDQTGGPPSEAAERLRGRAALYWTGRTRSAAHSDRCGATDAAEAFLLADAHPLLL